MFPSGAKNAVMSYIGNSQNYPRTLRNVFQTVEVPKLAINIKFKNFQKISRIRQKAVDKGVLVQGQDDFVPAKIQHEGRSIKVKLRLKGDWVDHFDTKKWSLRVHVGKKNHILGMRRFSIQHPKTRNYLMEKLIHDTNRRYGVLAPRYHFVDVSVNGESWGLMALEENFSKEMYESQQRKEGVVIRFDESLMWIIESEEPPNFPNPYKNYIINHIDSFRSSRISKSKKLSVENSFAVGLFRGFIEDNLSVFEVFDTELYGSVFGGKYFVGKWTWATLQ